MVEGKNDEAVTYANTKPGFGSLTIAKGEDHLVYIRDTDVDEGQGY